MLLYPSVPARHDGVSITIMAVASRQSIEFSHKNLNKYYYNFTIIY